MKLVLALAALCAILIVVPVSAAKPVPSGTIAIAAGSELNLGGWVSFDTTTDNVPGGTNLRVQIMCYQDVNESGTVSRTEDLDANGFVDDVVYGMALAADDSFELGGGSSDWLTNGGPAECDAVLFFWGVQGAFVDLAALTFAAGG